MGEESRAWELEASGSHFTPVSVSFSRKVRDSELFRLAQILPPFKSKGKYGVLIKTIL